jgi:hypothetical protein
MDHAAIHGEGLAKDCIGQIGKTGMSEGIYSSFRKRKIN